MPFLVDASFVRLAIGPEVFRMEPSVRNRNNGPLDRVIAVRKGLITSSACFMVGAVVS